jgi:hypothetical protein
MQKISVEHRIDLIHLWKLWTLYYACTQCSGTNWCSWTTPYLRGNTHLGLPPDSGKAPYADCWALLSQTCPVPMFRSSLNNHFTHSVLEPSDSKSFWNPLFHAFPIWVGQKDTIFIHLSGLNYRRFTMSCHGAEEARWRRRRHAALGGRAGERGRPWVGQLWEAVSLSNSWYLGISYASINQGISYWEIGRS